MNQATVPRLTTIELIDGCAAAGFGAVGLWRDRVAETGAASVRRCAEAAGVSISSLCRGGWFCTLPEGGTRAEDNRRAVDEAHEIGAAVLVLVCGPAPTKDLGEGREVIAEAIDALAHYTIGSGVRLAIEPMHPMYCADRSVVVTLRQALALARRAGENVGVMLDSYHLWWDPELPAGLGEARGLALGLQLADWLSPPPDPLNGRGMLGEGSIDLRGFVALVRDRAGYDGVIEIEIFNPTVWAMEPTTVLHLAAASYAEHVA